MHDPCLAKLESEWREAEDYREHAKVLRAIVNHVRLKEGVPDNLTYSIREKIIFLVSKLDSMELKEAVPVISAIDHAKRQLQTKGDYGGGLKGKLSADELREARRVGSSFSHSAKARNRKTRPLSLNIDDVFPSDLVDDNPEMD
jgi:hypothetical protein